MQKYSTCFGWPSQPSSGLHKIVTAASGTGHIRNIFDFSAVAKTWGKHNLYRYISTINLNEKL